MAKKGGWLGKRKGGEERQGPQVGGESYGRKVMFVDLHCFSCQAYFCLLRIRYTSGLHTIKESLRHWQSFSSEINMSRQE